jgi:S1-C subfamily serine protease
VIRIAFYDEAGRPMRTAVEVSEVPPGSAWEKTDLRRGDRIVGYNGEAIHNLADWTRARRDDRPGDPPRELRVLRGGQERTLQAPPGPLPPGSLNLKLVVIP